MTTTPLRLTPAEAANEATVERCAIAEFMYDRIMSAPYVPTPYWWALASLEERNVWRGKARELLTDLVAHP